ncbi:MAG: hypothetical protein WAX69_26985 [Victivallales bacterium]
MKLIRASTNADIHKNLLLFDFILLLKMPLLLRIYNALTIHKAERAWLHQRPEMEHAARVTSCGCRQAQESMSDVIGAAIAERNTRKR